MHAMREGQLQQHRHEEDKDGCDLTVMVSVDQLQTGLSQVLAENAAIQLHPAMQQVVMARQQHFEKGMEEDDATLREYLQALAACLVHEDFLLLLLKYLRPFLLDFMVRVMDPALEIYDRDDAMSQPLYRVVTNPMQRNERIAEALTTLLTFAPQTVTVVQQFFLRSPCFFEFVDVAAAQKQTRPDALVRLHRIVETAYRLLSSHPHEFIEMWNWSSFFPLCFHEDTHVRWYAARTTTLVLRMGNTQRNAFLNGLGISEETAISGKNTIVSRLELDEHVHAVTRQEQRIVMSVHEHNVKQNDDDSMLDGASRNSSRIVPFHESLTNICGVIIPTNKRYRNPRFDTSPSVEPLVPTSSTKRNLRSLAIALGLKRPILVSGSGGCGKTAIIRELARLSGNSDMVELHLDDQIDSKTLLGSYVCTDIPGEFTWQPGALTTAVLKGRWVVIEDIDRAPFEVLAALMSLLETREMVLPGRGELLVAHSNFQIFGTTSHGHQMPKGFQESIWTSVDIVPLHDDEIQEIMQTRFDRIPRHLITKIMTTYNVVSGNVPQSIIESSGASAAAMAHLWRETRRNYGRDFGLRDLLKWCSRIYSFCYSANTSINEHTDHNQYITEDERLRILVEAFDVFCAGIRDLNTRLCAAYAIGAIWEVQDEKIRYIVEQHKPHVSFNAHEVEFGRVHLPTLSTHDQQENQNAQSPSSVVMTGHVLRLLEKLAAIVYTREPALLIGETGCGKTTIIQHLAASMGQRLVVQNLNIQSDSSDLVGGFKPVEIHLLARPVYMMFVDLFTATFSQESNASFLNIVRIAFEHKDWKKMVKGMRKAIQMAQSKFDKGKEKKEATGTSKMSSKGASPSALGTKWDEFDDELGRFERQKEQVESHFAFAFVEGVLVKALREGHWVLLDEINLASSDTLERISTLLEHETSAFSITERGDVEIIRPHPNFRIFGAMNPSTDVGKKDLPPSLRNRFTEIYVDECVCPTDLQMVVQHQFKAIAGAPVTETVGFYLEARKLSEERLSDGARHKPRYSLRTLSQALHITRILIQRGYGISRAMYEGFSSSFCTQLDMDSRQYLEKLIKNTFAKNMKAKELTRAPPRPGGKAMANEFILVSSYWVREGGYFKPRDDSLPDPVTARKKFVLTKSVEENLRHLSRAALIGKYPVLLQGPTSAGKTSLISYLAARIGQKCVRINNHEHTDIQEYLGSYVSDSNGKLAFKEGVLVEAVRNGWWIILDELNLAPSEVLEALNRLLDDNRELFLPETQETVKPHPKFMLFATQNPPGLYGGRKVLSRAFRNRFLEIQVDEVGSQELQTILQERSSLPPSYCAILIDIMRQLQLIRQQSSIFAGKAGFITTRDLLRWAERQPATKQALAEEGYCLLAERLRKEEEKQVVKQVLEQKCNVKIDLDALYYSGKPRASNLLNENGEIEEETVWGTTEQFEKVQQMVEQAMEIATENETGKIEGNAAGLEKISVTKSLRRLFALVGRCLQHEEPVLLVGETGCGKTTVCQLYSLLFGQTLHILNCHQHTETSDFLGCLRPVRGKEKIAHELQSSLSEFLCLHCDEFKPDSEELSLIDMLTMYDSHRSTVLKKLNDFPDEKQCEIRDLIERVDQLKRRFQSIFEWCDGPLVESMKKGDLILIDEVNLAEDAVLERLNSVLEPSRTLLLAEKGGDQVEEIVAHPKWRVMATMNPGGDFGKRELSPALRNRFTEIWVPAISDLEDIATIIHDRLIGNPARTVLSDPTSSVHSSLAILCDPILNFVRTFNAANDGVGGCGVVTLRDILSWINFICSVIKKNAAWSEADIWTAFVQGAALSVLDGLGLGSDKALHSALKAREDAYTYLLELVPDADKHAKEQVLKSLNAAKQAIDDKIDSLNSADRTSFGINPFMIPSGPEPMRKPSFSLKAPTTMSNLYRVLRAMQVSRPIILEGSPGVGKTSLISALAAASGHRLVRINLSEQTDISDLFGSDLPAASSSSDADHTSKKTASSSGMFEWCDGVFLRALKAGDWVLLDELNLASQSVLEGLNSCLDHRGSVYIPELDREFECPSTFRVFAAQNPLRQGGGRKGLPKSFLNRFTRVFVETLHEQDLIHIATSMYPTLNSTATINGHELKSLIERMIAFNSAVHEDTMIDCKYGRLGAPWEFNLRDVFRFCELLQRQYIEATPEAELQALSYFVNFIYVERMRSLRDRAMISRRFEEFFGVKPMDLTNVVLRLSGNDLQVGNAFLVRRSEIRVGRVTPPLFSFLLKPMEALVHCVNMNWPALLVGPPASGKTSSVRLLAALSGNTLHELGMSAGTDATELLGCFEQVDVGRKLREIQTKIGEVYARVQQKVILFVATTSQQSKSASLKHINRLTSTWWTLSRRQSNDDVDNASGNKRKKHLAKGQLDNVAVDLMKDILSTLKKAVMLLIEEKDKPFVEETIASLIALGSAVDNVVALSKSPSIASNFEWVDGTLIQAMENGEWILLDNVNFCSSSVLDRLNSLLETGGELLINECGVIDGKLRVIKPHPNFRVFLAMDPQFGEVSRAMRNRCVEIALLPEEEQNFDLIKISLAAGIPGFALCHAFQQVHKRVMEKLSERMVGTKYSKINRRHLENWSLLVSAELNRGVSPLNAIATSFQQVYGEGLLMHLELGNEVLQLFLGALKSSLASPNKQRVLALNTTALELCQRAESHVLERDCAYLEFLITFSLEEPNTADVEKEEDLLLAFLASNASVESSLLNSAGVSERKWLDCLAARKYELITQDMLDSVKQYLTTQRFFAASSLSMTLAPFALRRLVQVSSTVFGTTVTEDRLLFVLEMIASVAKTSYNVGDSVDLLVRYLRSLLNNSIYVGIASQVKVNMGRLLTLVAAGDEETAKSSYPVFLTANDAAFKHARSLVYKTITANPVQKAEIEPIWLSVLEHSKNLELLDGIEWLRFCEDEQYRQVDTLFSSISDRKKKQHKTNLESDLSRYSVLQQSYAIHRFHADRSSVENELVLLVYPLLTTFDTFLTAFVRDFAGITVQDELFQVVKTALRDRFEFSIQLREPTFDWMHFLIHWQWTSKSLMRLCSNLEHQNMIEGKWEKSLEDLVNMIQRMQDAIDRTIGCGSKKNVLWKRGGHTLLPSSPKLWRAKYLLERLTSTFMHVDTCFSSTQMGSGKTQQVDVLALLFGGTASMEAAMKIGQLDISSLFFVDVEARKEVLYALCAFSYLAQQQVNTKRRKHNDVPLNNPYAMMAEELFKLPEVLLKKLETKKRDVTAMIMQKTLYLSEIEDNGETHLDLLTDEDRQIGKDAPILLFDMQEGAKLMDQLVNFQLSPLFEHSLARVEVHVISQLIRVVNVYQLYHGHNEHQHHQEILELVTELLSTMELLVEDLLNVGTRDPTTFHAYQDIVWCGHKFLTSSSVNKISKADIETELEVFVALVKTHMNGILYGFHQFLRCNSFNDIDAISYEIFDTQKKLRQAAKQYTKKPASRDEEDQTQVVFGYPRLFQSAESAVVLKSIAEVDLHDSTCATVEAQVRQVRLEKIKQHFASTQLKSIDQMMATTWTLVKELFVSTVLAFESTFSLEQWVAVQQLLQHFGSNDFMLTSKNQLIVAMKHSQDPTFSASVEQYIIPFFTSLQKSQSNGSKLSSFGECFILLGLWRFALMIPSSPVDPVTKPIVKRELLMNRLAMLTMQKAADIAMNRMNPLPAGSKQHHVAANEAMTILANEVTEVSAHAFQRYNPEQEPLQPVTVSVFGDFFRDLLKFQATIMPTGKMLSLLGTVLSSLTSQQKCRQMLRELEMFQQTSESFLAQISKKYGVSFSDIVEPVAATVYAVKEGVALLSWSIRQHLQDQSVKNQEKSALVLTLVQFPSAINHRLRGAIEDPWRGIQLLLQTVGSKASSIIFGGSRNQRKSELALLDVGLAKLEFLFRETVSIYSTFSDSSISEAVVEAALQSSKSLFDLFLAKWQEQKEREEQKRKEAEEMFKYKTRHLDIESEEQLLEEEYRQQFPDYTVQDFQAFLSPDQAGQNAISSAISNAADADVLITDTMMRQICEAHVKLYAASANSKVNVTKQEIVNAFARAFFLTVLMRSTINAMSSSAVEEAIVSSGVFAASLVHSRLGSSDTRSAVPSLQSLSADYIRGIDFHRDPLVKEVVLVAKPLQELMIKLQSLLSLWPEHAILQQLVMIADRIRNFPISSPLARTLTGVELLLRKAQEWEAYAARDYSIANELAALSALVTRWRKLELYSWPHLLYVKEKQHQLTAQKTWFHMYSLLTGQFEADAQEYGSEELLYAHDKNELKWLHLNSISHWLFPSSRKGEAENEDMMSEVKQKRFEWMSQLFSTLDAYIRTCPIGQYETRLLIVYSFCSQLFMEFWNLERREISTSENKKTSYALANMLYHLYRYYGQHLGYLERQWSGLKAPIQQKLIEFVKICRWDEQTYYSLAESAEKSHRKLMKFVRDYEAVLAVSMQTVIDASTDSGITKEGGFVGIHATKAELNNINDGVEIPKMVNESVKDKDEDEEELPNVKKESPAEEEEIVEKASPLVLVHKGVSLESIGISPIPEISELSPYADKVEILAKRISKFTQRHILSRDQIELRQQPREICEDLCETIFYRMTMLQKATNLPKGAKKKALIDLLSELKAQGISYHRMHLPPQQQQMQQLFELDVPDVDNCLQVDGLDDLVDADEGSIVPDKLKKTKRSKKNGKTKTDQVVTHAAPSGKKSPSWLWQRADGYYYRFLSQITSLRFSAQTNFSHDLSSSEVDRMNGYAENMLYSMLHQRQVLHATALNHEKLIAGLDSLMRMKEFKTNYLSNDVNVSLKAVTKWQEHQGEAVLALRKPLRELEITVVEVLRASSSTPSVSTISEKFRRVFELLENIHSSFVVHSGTRRTLGVPAIPYQSVKSSEDVNGEPTLTAFAHPSQRVFGISPLASIDADESAKQQKPNLFPMKLDILKANSTHFLEIKSLLENISALFGQVAPSTCFNLIMPQLSSVVEHDQNLMTLAQKKKSSIAQKNTKYAAAESKKVMETFIGSYNALVETVLVAIQDLTKKSQEKMNKSEADDNMDEREQQSLRDQLSHLNTVVKDSRVNQIALQLANLLELLAQQQNQLVNTESSDWRQVFVYSLSLLERFEPSLLDVRGISRQLLVDFLVTHKSVTKLDFVLIRIFRNLYQHGFCRADEQKEEDGESSGDGKMQFQDDVEGTGMGEGEGKKDVSHEIEDEEQLLGLQGDQQPEQPEKQDQPPQDTGLEMQNDFDGTMQDLPDDEQNENEDDQDDDEKEELDREMGDFDQEDENVVDEKMWGEDSDDDEDKIDKENEKFEEDSKVEGEALEDEIRGKDDDDDNKEKDDAKKDEEKKNEKQQPEKQQEDGGAGDDSEEENGDEADKEGQVNDDFEDKYEENNDVDPQNREDGGEDNEEQEDDGQLPENMQLDEGNDGGDEGEGEDEDGDHDMDQLDDEDMDEEKDEGGDDNVDGEKDENQDKEEEEPIDSAVQMGAGGLDDEQQEEEADDHNDQDQVDQEDPSQEQEKAASTVAGTRSKDGQDELEHDEEEKEDQEMDESSANDDKNESKEQDRSSSSAQQQSNSNDDDEKAEWKPQSQVSNAQENQQQEEKRRNRRQNEPNPYRNPQNTQEHWKRRVEMIEREQDSNNSNEDPHNDQDQHNDMSTAEFVDDDDINMDDVQHALAAADENQIMNQNQNLDEDEMEGQDNEDDEQTDPVGAGMMDVDDDESVEKEEEAAKDEDKQPPIKKETNANRDHEANADMLDPQSEQEKDKNGDEPIRTDDNVNMDIDEEQEEANAFPTVVHQSDLEKKLTKQDEESADESTRPPPKLLSPEEVAALRDELDTFIANWSRDDSSLALHGADLWSKYTAVTSASAQRLCEQLRLVLEPMLRAKLEGDFRTGKRINMRKVIPYIASQFRKDKIWMRRTRPSKRQYQVMVAIDDSESMADNHAGRLALEAMTTLCKGMTQLEVGEISVVKFGQTLQLLHSFDTPFTDDAGSRIISQFGFQQKKTNMVQTLDAILQILENAKNASTAASNASNVEFTQIVFLISDGRFDTDGRVRIKKLIETALEQQQLIVLLIVDDQSEKSKDTSILETKSVTFTKGKVTMVPYLENYPFPYYVLLPTSTLLPEILSDSLRQWFEMLQMKS